MRFAAYAGTSVVLAAGTILRAFLLRANFYSAAVQISQSNACLMILTNVALLGVSMVMLGLQRLFYGPLRPIEVEQLYEKAWFAITETCLAMTIFREEVGGWFLVMFVSLLIGKIWGWIGEGRVEILEQQPPANPRLFHAQLSLSLLISVIFDTFMLQYSIKTVLRHARPNMMVMFAFEFAVLTVTSVSTAARYAISVYETTVIARQTRDKRAQLKREREQERSRRAASEGSTDSTSEVPSTDDDIDSMDIDTPGWEEKGRWIFYLDLTTDFFKLVLYITFFCVLCMFYGMPIHIIRDVALTIRSFYKRITDFVRYRQATRDMNARYPDATTEEVAREDVCIICREDIAPWPPHSAQQTENGAPQPNPTPAAGPADERLRPKKLPCGHILHFACLRSWLERQQICPTCRRPVLVPNTTRRNRARQPQQPNGAQPQGPAAHAHPQPNTYQFGPIRIAFGVRHGRGRQVNQNAAQGANQQQMNEAAAAGTRGGPQSTRQLDQQRTFATFPSSSIPAQLQHIEQQIARDISDLRLQADQLQVVRSLQSELTRLRMLSSTSGMPIGALPSPVRGQIPAQTVVPNGLVFAGGQTPLTGPSATNQLPPGMTLPEGWSVLPLRPLLPAPVRIPQTGQTSGATAVGPSNRTLSTGNTSTSHLEPRPTDETQPSVSPALSSGPNGLDSSAPLANGTETAPAPTSDPHGTPRSGENGIPASGQSSNGDVVEPVVTTPDIPQWGTRPANQVPNGSQDSPKNEIAVTSTTPGGIEASSSEAAESEQHQNKGKGRAATVEDSIGDLD